MEQIVDKFKKSRPNFVIESVQPNGNGAKITDVYGMVYLVNENGIIHADDIPAVTGKGHEYWYNNGVLDRKEYPAVIGPNGSRYYMNGKLHRTDGPAIIHADDRKEYFVNGQPMTQKFKKWASKKKLEAHEEDFLIFVFENNIG